MFSSDLFPAVWCSWGREWKWKQSKTIAWKISVYTFFVDFSFTDFSTAALKAQLN